MTTTRRIFSMVLALMMVLSLSVTAFADDVGTATINIVVDGETTTITASANQKLDAVLDQADKAGTIGTVTWETVKDWEDPKVSHKALKGIGDNVSEAGTTENLADTDFKNLTEEAAVAGHPGYYLVSQEGNSYHYVYVGYDWTYTSTTVGGGDLYTYMCCYTLTAGEIVTITYSLQITDWTQTGAIQ